MVKYKGVSATAEPGLRSVNGAFMIIIPEAKTKSAGQSHIQATGIYCMFSGTQDGRYVSHLEDA